MSQDLCQGLGVWSQVRKVVSQHLTRYLQMPSAMHKVSFCGAQLKFLFLISVLSECCANSGTSALTNALWNAINAKCPNSARCRAGTVGTYPVISCLRKYCVMLRYQLRCRAVIKPKSPATQTRYRLGAHIPAKRA